MVQVSRACRPQDHAQGAMYFQTPERSHEARAGIISEEPIGAN